MKYKSPSFSFAAFTHPWIAKVSRLLLGWQSFSITGFDLLHNITPQLQIRGGDRDNLDIIFLLLNENIHCDPSFELPQRDDSPQWDDSNEGSQCMFKWKNIKIIPRLFMLSLLIWSTESHAFNHLTMAPFHLTTISLIPMPVNSTTKKNLASVVSYFCSLMKMTYWCFLILAFMIHHGSR